MEILLKTAAICIPAAIFSAVIKKDNPAMALILTVAAGVITLYISLDVITEVSDFLFEVADAAGVSSPVLSTVFKVTGISVISRVISDVCKDAGNASASSAAEFAGTSAALYASMPLMKTALDMIRGIM